MEKQTILLLIKLIEAKAKECKAYATLWESNPEKYGADEATIARQRGMEDAFREIERMIKEIMSV
jgi:hypothetical protein